MGRSNTDNNTISKIQSLRRAGFSFGEIADALEVPKSTVIYYCSAIKVDKDGHNEVVRILADIAAALEPGQPFKELPLPNIAIAKINSLRNIMSGSERLRE